ncbi:MAG: hypothetical protein WDO74_11505 [Pseudomonadota bacterium]
MPYLKNSVSALAVLAALSSFGCGSDDDPSDAKLALTSPRIEAGKPLPAEFTCEGKEFGESSSPELNWSHESDATKSYAILLKDLTIESGQSVADPDPEHPYHWAIWNIPRATHKLPAALSIDQIPFTGAQQQNGAPPFIKAGPYGYFGPCPNLGVWAGAPSEVHNDVFILYTFSDAVLTPPAYDPGTGTAPLNPVRQLAEFFEAHPSLIATAELKFTSDAKPATCPGFPNPPFACVP